VNITQYLDQQGVNYQACSHRPTFTAQQMAAEEHVSGMYVAKPVIVQADNQYYMCVLPACCKVDLSQFAQQIGAEDVRLADEKEMAKLFPECELGAEPPFGNLFGLTTIMDDSLAADEYLLFQAGQHDRAIRLDMDVYKKLVTPRILNFSYHLH